MAFDIRLWMYPGQNPDNSPSDWGAEADISAYLRRPGDDGGQPISYSGGKGDEAPGVDAGQMQLTLDNRDGRFSTDNIAGPYYGDLDTNTPIRMGVVCYSDSFTRAASASGWGTPTGLGSAWTHTTAASNWTTDGTSGAVTIGAPNSAALATAVDGDAKDVDVTVTITPSAIATGARYAAGVRVRISEGDPTTFLAAVLSFGLAGAMILDIYRFSTVAGTTLLAGLDPIPSATYTAGQAWKLRVQAEGDVVRAKAWPAADPEPAAWHLDGQDTSALVTGSGLGLYTARFASNSNSGTNIMRFDDFLAVGLEFTGSVVSWPVRWDLSGNNSWAPITAAGILRRVRQGTYPIQSPLRRAMPAQLNMTGYWPLEDGATAISFSSVVAGQPPATFNGVTPAAANDLAGGGPAPTLDTAAGLIRGRTSLVNGGTGFAGMVLFKLGSIPSVKTRIIQWRCSRGPVRRWDMSVSDTTLWVEGIDGDGTVLTSNSGGWGPWDPDAWYAWQLECDKTLVPSNTTWSAIIHKIGDVSYYALTGNVLGTSDSTLSDFLLTGPAGTAFGHVWMGRNTLPFVTDSFSQISSGYSGELAADRFARVCTEAGIPYTVRPGDSEAMGPQREAGTLAVLESCVETDYGVMAERGHGLEFIPRSTRWNPVETMAVSVAAGQIAGSPEPTRDDQRLRNRWTVARTAGGEGFYQDNISAAKHGIWEDSVTINSKDDSVLENHAGFRVAIGTQQRMRWPSVALNFSRNPGLLPAWRARGYGWRLAVTTGKDQVQGNEPDLIVEGFQCRLDPDMWTAELACSSADVWRAAVTDDTGILGRADNEYCETTALISSTALTIPITTTSGSRWDNTAGLWTAGVDFYVGGERVTVTSITNGVDPAQTLNCTVRGVNGYAASHASGTKVRLWDPAIAAL
jgi:hypothetical protein